MRLAWALAVSSLTGLSAAQVQFVGVAIAGGDFGCQTDGTCPTGSTQLPLGSSGGDGPGQMQHWTSISPKPLNMFRLPISWQFLVNNQLGGNLDSTNIGKYDQLVQSCLSTGAYCMIDIHNFARWNTGIIGQGGPTDDQFVSLWTQLATKYASEDKMVFEVMNEPHDLDITVWAATCQKVVTAIRNAGATSQMILLSGTDFDSAATLVSSGSVAALMNVTNPDGTTDNLLLDIHKYLDEDNSGTHTTCTTNNIDAFTTVADALRQAGRKGFISESGASSDSSCVTDFCAQNSFINQNGDVFVGFVGWGAGSFATSYVLSLTPTKQNNQYVDNQVMQQCIIDVWNNTTTTATSSAAASAAPSSSGAANTVSQSTVYITPIKTTTVNSFSSTALTGETSTLTLSTATAALNTGSGQDGLETATGTPTGARGAATASSSQEAGLITATSGSPNSTSTASTTAATAPIVANSDATVTLSRSGELACMFASATLLWLATH